MTSCLFPPALSDEKIHRFHLARYNGRLALEQFEYQCRDSAALLGGEAKVSDNMLSACRAIQACQPERALQGADARQGTALFMLGTLHALPINAANRFAIPAMTLKLL